MPLYFEEKKKKTNQTETPAINTLHQQTQSSHICLQNSVRQKLVLNSGTPEVQLAAPIEGGSRLCFVFIDHFALDIH